MPYSFYFIDSDRPIKRSNGGGSIFNIIGPVIYTLIIWGSWKSQDMQRGPLRALCFSGSQTSVSLLEGEKHVSWDIKNGIKDS